MSFQAKCDAMASWIAAALEEELEEDDVFEALRSGAILCQLMNQLDPNQCADFDPFPETPDAEHDNLEQYLAACGELEMENMFAVDDLASPDGDVRKVLANVMEFAGLAEVSGFPLLELPEGGDDGDDDDGQDEGNRNEGADGGGGEDVKEADEGQGEAGNGDVSNDNHNEAAAASAPKKAAARPATAPPSNAGTRPKGPVSPRKIPPGKGARSRPGQPPSGPGAVKSRTRPPLPPGAKKASPKKSPAASRRSAARAAAKVAPTKRVGVNPTAVVPSPTTAAAEKDSVEQNSDSVTRPRGETDLLMEWKPPSSSDESASVENTRLKAQAERAALQLASQTKLKEDAMVKLQKEREKVRQLEADLDAERMKASATARVSPRVKDSEATKKLVEELQQKVDILEQELSDVKQRNSELEDRVNAAESKAAEMEEAFNAAQMELEAQEEQSAKEIRQLEDDALYLTGELNRYKEMVEENEAKGGASSAKEQELSALLKKKDEELRAAQVAFEKQAAEHVEEIEALKSLQSLKGPSDAEVARLKQELNHVKEQAEQERTEAENEVLETKAELEEVKAQLEEAELKAEEAEVKAEQAEEKVEKLQQLSPRVEKSLPSPRRPSGASKASNLSAKPQPRMPSKAQLVDSMDLEMEVPRVSSIVEEQPASVSLGAGRKKSKGSGGSNDGGAQVSELEQSLIDLLCGEYAEIDPGLFEEEENRQLLTRVIKQNVEKGSVVDLKGAEFDNLIEILRIVLDRLDFDSPDDFRCAKRILQAGSVLRNEGVFIKEEIWDSPIFTEPIFWDDLCVGKIARAFENQDMAESQVDNTVFDTLQSLAAVMVGWNVSDEVLLEVIGRAAENEGLAEEDVDEIIANVRAESEIKAARPAGGGTKAAKKPVPAKKTIPKKSAAPPSNGTASNGESGVIREGQLKFKKASKWIKAHFTLTGSAFSYSYTEEGIGDFGEDIELTGAHSASAGSDQAPGALRNYSFKLCEGSKPVLHLLAAKQPEVNEWISVIMEVCQKAGGGVGVSSRGAPAVGNVSVGKAAGAKRLDSKVATSGAGQSKLPTRAAAGSQPPVRIERSATAQMRLIKEGDVKMLVQRRWLRTHVELFEGSIVLNYIDPTNNSTQLREDIPIGHVLIAPNSPLAPAALKDSSWRIKDAEDEYHLMSNSKSEATGWLGQIKETRDTFKAKQR